MPSVNLISPSLCHHDEDEDEEEDVLIRLNMGQGIRKGHNGTNQVYTVGEKHLSSSPCFSVLHMNG